MVFGFCGLKRRLAALSGYSIIPSDGKCKNFFANFKKEKRPAETENPAERLLSAEFGKTLVFQALNGGRNAAAAVNELRRGAGLDGHDRSRAEQTAEFDHVADRFAAHNGITVEDADYDYGKVSLAFEDHAKNSLDMLHGGALFTLADMAFGLASNFGQEDGTMISTNATISYMKSAKTGPIVAEARLANGGRHLATYEVKIYDGQGTYIACAMISGYRLDTKLAIEE